VSEGARDWVEIDLRPTDKEAPTDADAEARR